MAALGLKASDYADDDTVFVWAENWPAVDLFIALGTQWRSGASGATGIDYTSVPVVLRMRGTPRRDWPELFESLQVMERAALDEMSKHG